MNGKPIRGAAEKAATAIKRISKEKKAKAPPKEVLSSHISPTGTRGLPYPALQSVCLKPSAALRES